MNDVKTLLARWFRGKYLIYFMLYQYDFPNKLYPQLSKIQYSNTPIFQYSNWGEAPRFRHCSLVCLLLSSALQES